jgi:hypothetical protein
MGRNSEVSSTGYKTYKTRFNIKKALRIPIKTRHSPTNNSGFHQGWSKCDSLRLSGISGSKCLIYATGTAQIPWWGWVEDGGSRFSQKTGNHLYDYTLSQHNSHDNNLNIHTYSVLLFGLAPCVKIFKSIGTYTYLAEVGNTMKISVKKIGNPLRIRMGYSKLTPKRKNPKVHHHIHNSWIQSTPPANLPKLHSDYILPSTPWSSEWSLSFGLCRQNLAHISLLSHARHMPCPPHSPWHDPPNDIWGWAQITKVGYSKHKTEIKTF